MLPGSPAKASCAWVYQPRAASSSASTKTSSPGSVEVKHTTVVSGSAISRKPSTVDTAAARSRTASRVARASSRYPASPMCRSVAYAPAIGPPGRVEEMPGFTTVYPGQPAQAKYCGRRIGALRCSSTDTPLDAYAYLCRSTEIEVTPGTDRSNGGTGWPSRRRYGRLQPPKQASTWQRTPAASAAAAMSATGSINPYG